MDAIDILINEHANIKKVLSAIRRDCEELVEGKPVNIEFYRSVIDFVRNYADKYHHKKEEKKLFNIMSEINENIKNGPIMGMLMEHDLGRMYIKNLDEAITSYEKGDKKKKAYIVANALSYEEHLSKHIDKEDKAIYMMARRQLDINVQELLKKEFDDIERDVDNSNLRKKYIEFANKL
jgi:hemerythrin-like domain-containing protein